MDEGWRKLETSWNYNAILLSFVVGLIGCYTTTFPLFMLERSRVRLSRCLWLMTSCFLYGGCCIWCLHFTGMAALNIGVTVTYDPTLTVTSFLVAMAGSMIAFYVRFHNIFMVTIGEDFENHSDDLEMLEDLPLLGHDLRVPDQDISIFQIGHPSIIFGGLFFAKAICGMHYVGMAAMRIEGVVKRYDYWRIVLSFLIAWTISIFTVNSIPRVINFPKQVLFSIISTFGVFSMHYTGMTAVTFWSKNEIKEPVPSSMKMVGIIVLIVSLTCFSATSVAAHTITIQRDDLVRAIKTESHLKKLSLEKDFLEQENNRKSEFMAIVSHEIRTPLNAISGFVDLMQTENLLEDQKNALDLLKQSVKILSYTLDNVLTYTRLENIKPKKEPFDISETIWNVVKNLYGMTNNKIAVYVVDENKHGITVNSDVGLLIQVLQNLISNAYKFTDDGYVLVTHTMIKDRGIYKIIIQDSGIGISKSHMQEIFEPFKQLDTSLTRRYTGMGLGLSICKRIASLLGGDIVVESTLHVESTFTFTFPCTCVFGEEKYSGLENYTFKLQSCSGKVRVVLLKAFERMGMKMSTKDDASTDVILVKGNNNLQLKILTTTGLYTEMIFFPVHLMDVYKIILNYKNQKRREEEKEEEEEDPEITEKMVKGCVLVVEDNTINQRLLACLLKKLGYDFEIASNGVEALSIMMKHQFDYFTCILMDIQMPEMDGFEATTRIRQRNKQIPIIALTANVSESSRMSAKESGMTGFLEKPIKMEKLKELLIKVHA